ncbi:MAG: serine protease [Pseudomonadota bacterium]
MRFVPDWLIYILAIGAIFFIVSRFDEDANAPPAPPDELEAAGNLPPPPSFDPSTLVDTSIASGALGSAFAISQSGWWLTARHLVDSCNHVGIVVAHGAAAEVSNVRLASFADLALLKTDSAPIALALATSESNLEAGQRAYHIGFPQGQPGEAYSRLMGREFLASGGRNGASEPVMAWSIIGHTEHLEGSLAGLNGGPAIGPDGVVVGVTIAESARRGRVYTASPASIHRLLDVEHISVEGDPAPRMQPEDYGEQADNLRRSLAVAQIVCISPFDKRRNAP